MADELTATGLSLDSLEDRIEALKGLLRAAIATNLDLSTEQPTGQLVKIFSERVQAALELVQAVHRSIDPDSATGDALTALCLLTGTQRNAATHGHVTLSLDLAALTTVPAGSVAAVAGAADNRWITDVPVTSVGAGVYTVAATAEDTGPVQAVAGTITVIATPVAGWNTVTNAADATLGLSEETDTALRLRRENELAIGGSTSVDAIRSELSQLVGMIEATVLENDLDTTVDGIPPHAIEAVVWDGSPPAVANADIAETIFESKAGGIRAWGSTLVAHVDDQGNPHAIRFTRAEDLRIVVDVDVDTEAGYIGNAAVAAYIEAQAALFFRVGGDVYRSRITDWVMDCAGVVNVALVQLSIFPAAVAAADIVVDVREIATIDVADVTVH